MKVSIDEGKCIACRTCEGMCPECFKVDDEKNVATVLDAECSACDANEVASSCPVGAILVEE